MKKLALMLALAASAPLIPGTAHAGSWSKTCLGYKADVVGTSKADVLRPRDTNGDLKWVVLGMGGDDTFENVGLDSGSPMHVYFCGGDGRDTVNGYVRGFNGQSGRDTANLYDCMTDRALLKSVERTTVAYECGQMP